MNTDLFLDNEEYVRGINLGMFIILAVVLIKTKYSSIALLALGIQSSLNLIGQISTSIKYQDYNMGPISSPFLGSEIASFTIISLVLTNSIIPLPFSINTEIFLILTAGLLVFVISSILPYLWLFSGLTVIGLAAYFVDSAPYASTSGIITVSIMIGITHANQILVNKIEQTFVNYYNPTELSVGESHIESEFAYGEELDSSTESLWYCRIPLDDNNWFTIKEDSKNELKDALTSEYKDGLEGQNIQCVMCGSDEGILNIKHGLYCEKNSPVTASASKSQICTNCSQDVFRHILQDESIDEFRAEEYISRKI